MIITVSGEPGAGSTTISELLAKKLKYKLLTVGEIHKKIAAENGMTIKEYWEHQEKNKEEQKHFHEELDRKQKQLAEREKNLILNGKLSAFQVPSAKVRVLLTCSLKERARRTSERDKITPKKAEEDIKKREEIERKDWKRIYGFDYVKDTQAYTLIIDTTKLRPEQIAEKIMQEVK